MAARHGLFFAEIDDRTGLRAFVTDPEGGQGRAVVCVIEIGRKPECYISNHGTDICYCLFIGHEW